MNFLWLLLIFSAVIYSCISGNLAAVSAGIFPAVQESVRLTLSILGMFCFWSGIMQVAQSARLTDKIAALLSPLLHFLFPSCRSRPEIKAAISMNISANLLGIGNAATPLGIQAMKKMQAENPHPQTATNEMVLFVILNTASLRLIPSTAAFLRAENGSSEPMSIFLPALLTTLCACCGAIFSAKCIGGINRA